MTRRIESQRDQFPRRVANHHAHPDLAECHRAHGTVHSSCGRIMPGWKLAVADTATQESRLADTAGWTHHVAVPPSPLAIQGARAYSSLKGFDDPHASDYTHIMQDPQRVARVGRHYDSLPVYTPDAVPHFLAMQKEVNDQYDFLTKRMGINVQPVDYDPYANVQELMNDIHGNKTLKVLGSHVTGGHPVFGNADNDKFRAVHDFFGHAATGRDFDRHGEHATYLAHGKMFTPQALPALTTETLGQNSSLILNGHFGPNKIGTIPRELTARKASLFGDDTDHEDWWYNEDEDEQEEHRVDPVRIHSPLFRKEERPIRRDPKLQRDIYHFLPHDVNPASDADSRPYVDFERGGHWNEPTLDLRLPPAEHTNYDRPVTQHPNGLEAIPAHNKGAELYRGLTVDLNRRELAPLRRAIYGDEKESFYSGDPNSHYMPPRRRFEKQQPYQPGMFPGTFSDKELAAPAAHPDQLHQYLELLLDHMQNHKDTHHMGLHWSTDPTQADNFAETHSIFNREKGILPVRMTGRWYGRGEDPYRRHTEEEQPGEYEDEREISMLSGAPLDLTNLEIYHPKTREWHSLMDGAPRRIHAAWGDQWPGLGKPSGVPSSLDTPRFTEKDRPWLPDNSRLFLPNEVNPPSESHARPSTTWYGTYHEDEPLPIGHHTVDILPDRNYAIERQPYELHRGIQFYLGDSNFNAHSPVLGRLRRLLRGDAMESSGRHTYDDHDNWAPMLEGMPSNEQATSVPNRKNYAHPEIPHLILEHLLHTQDTDLDNHRDSLGRHWSTSRDMANRFAKIFPNQQYFDHHKLSAVLTGKWKGVGEDPYRRNTDGDFDDEREITLLPGAPIHLHQLHVFDPNIGNWVTHDLGGIHRTAKGKTKKKKVKPPQYYRDWSGPKRMWFLTDEGLHHEPEDTFTTSNPKQLYQLLRNDNTFAQQYRQHLEQQTYDRPQLPATDAQGREFIGMLRRDFPDVMNLLGDL